MSENKLESSLLDNKLSFTQQRRVILEELNKADTHLTADEIYFLVKKRMSKVSVGTIYRNLGVLTELGLIDKVITSLHEESHYEVHKEGHYHIICLKCKKIDDLEHYRALSIEPTAEKISGYKIKNHLIELHGICQACQGVTKPEIHKDTENKETLDSYFGEIKPAPTKGSFFPKKRRFFFGRKQGS